MSWKSFKQPTTIDFLIVAEYNDASDVAKEAT